MKKFKEPYFLVDFKSSICNYEILINDVPAYIHTDDGSISSHYPINHLILESGKQIIKIRILPLKGELSIREDASLKVMVFAYDSSTTNYGDTLEVFKYATEDLSANKLPLIEVLNTFLAEVPYKLKGWKSAIETKDQKTEIINFYTYIFGLFNEQNISKIHDLCQKRFDEIDTAMYLYNVDNKQDVAELFSRIKQDKMELEPLPTQFVILKYADKRLVNAVRENQDPIISYKNVETGDQFTFPILIGYENNKFIVIR